MYGERKFELGNNLDLDGISVLSENDISKGKDNENSVIRVEIIEFYYISQIPIVN